MADSCTLKPWVKNPKGEMVESKLFNDLLHYTQNDRKLTKKYYTVDINRDFLSAVESNPKYHVDENGEITFSSLRSLANIDINTDRTLQVLNKDIEEGDYSYDIALNKVQQFNENSDFSDNFFATITPTENPEKFHVSVKPVVKEITDSKGKKHQTSSLLDEQQAFYNVIRDREIENRIIDLLKEYGVSVEFIEKNVEGGFYSTDKVTKLENGLYGLIKVFESGNVTGVLAEETGHFIIGSLGDNPLVKRLESLLNDSKVQKELLGNEEYYNAQLGDNPAREMAGRIVGMKLEKQLKGNHTILHKLIDRIISRAKMIFHSLTGNDLGYRIAKAEQIANKIAYGFQNTTNLENSDYQTKNALSYREVLHNASLTKNQATYKKVIDDFGRMCKQLEAICSDSFKGKMESSFAQTIMAATDNDSGESALQMNSNSLADGFAFDGIVQALTQIYGYMEQGKEIDSLLSSIDENDLNNFYSNMAQNGRKLRQVRVFLINSQNIIKTIKDAIQGDVAQNKLVNPSGQSIHNVNYQDFNQVWHTIDMDKTLRNATLILEELSRLLSFKESYYFARFCEDIYGKNYVDVSVGKLWRNVIDKNDSQEKEGTYTIDQLVTGENGCVTDIDIFHRYLASMSNNPDIIGQIVDKAVRMANKVADDQTIQYRDRLIIMKNRAKALGLNIEDLVERDENGIPTGNIILPPPSMEHQDEIEIFNAYSKDDPDFEDNPYSVNYGKWEKAREEFKKAKWEEFKVNNPTWKSMSGFTRGYLWDQFYRGQYKIWNKQNSVQVVYTDPITNNIIKKQWLPNALYKYEDNEGWNLVNDKYKDKETEDGDNIYSWIRDYMEIKRQLDSMLPEYATVSRRLPQFRGTFSASIRNSGYDKQNFIGRKVQAAKNFWRRDIIESFCMTSQDEDYGDNSTMNHPDDELLGTALDYEQERPNRLPIFGINKMEHMEDMSTDIIGSMLGYATMATTYQSLNSIVDSLEVGKQTMYDREVRPRRVNNSIDSITYNSDSRVREAGNTSRIYGRYLKFLDKQVYGISASSAGVTWGKKRVLLNKIMNNISALGGALYLAGNVQGGTVNTITGFTNIFKEAVTGEDFTMKDWAFANKWYYKYWPKMMMESGRLHKDDKLSLFLNMMNFKGDNKSDFKKWFTERNIFNNMMRNLAYLPYSAGDHYMQAMSYLAIAHGTQLYSPGQTTSPTNLWDAFQYEDNKLTNEGGQTFSKGRSLKFNKLLIQNTSEITYDNIENYGVYLKKVGSTSQDFDIYLTYFYPEALDESFKLNNNGLMERYKKSFLNNSQGAKQQLVSELFDKYKELLKKVEEYVDSNSPLSNVPVFSEWEKKFLKAKGINEADYKGILQTTKESIYRIIWTKSDEGAFMNKSRELNNRMHGIYNNADKTAFHQNMYMNMTLSMRGWALGNIEMIFSSNHYSVALGRDTEGFLNTGAKMLVDAAYHTFLNRNTGLDFKDLLVTFICPWSKRASKIMQKAGYTKNQYMNVRRLFMSYMIIALLWGLKMSLLPDDDDDENDNDSVLKGNLYYFTMRALLEQEALLMPWEIINNAQDLTQLLPVGGTAMADLMNLIAQSAGAIFADEDNSLYFYQRDDTNERYERGTPKAWVHAQRLIPYWKNVWGIMHPYQAAENYEFGRKMKTR